MFECLACGFKTKAVTKQNSFTGNSLDGFCNGCARHFGINEPFGMSGATDLTYEQTLAKLNEIEEAKHILCMQTRSFGVEATGDMVGIDYGDIFQVFRVGATKDFRPTGKWDYAMKAFTISIKINGHDLTLFPHEVMPIHWVAIMELKKNGDYSEAYLSTEDNSGYWQPSKEMKKEMVHAYGDR